MSSYYTPRHDFLKLSALKPDSVPTRPIESVGFICQSWFAIVTPETKFLQIKHVYKAVV